MLIALQAVELGGFAVHFRGANTLVSFLRIFGFVLINAGFSGDVFCAIFAFDKGARGGYGLGGHVYAVGPHIGDVARLIKPLGGGHGLLGAKAELAAGFLLQGGGHKRRGGVARAGLGLDLLDGKRAGGNGLHGQLCGGRCVEVKLLQLLAAKHREAGLETLAARGFKQGFYAPVFFVVKRFNFHLALNNEAQADRLHTASGFCAGELAPKHRREVEAHQIIQRTPRKIGLNQRHIHLARVFHGLSNGRFGDGVKNHALHMGALLDHLALFQRFLKVPANRLTFAVGVGCENEFIFTIGLHSVDNGAHVLLRMSANLPLHFEIVFGIHRAILWRQVADVAIGGEHGKARPEVFFNRFGLGRGFDNNNSHAGILRISTPSWARNMVPIAGKCQWGINARLQNA